MPFAVGHKRIAGSGRAKGTPNHATADIKALALKVAPEAVKTLEHIMIHDKNSATRVAAAKELLDRGIGRPTQAIAGESGEGPAVIRHVISWRGWNPPDPDSVEAQE